jgi:hypothetical protein
MEAVYYTDKSIAVYGDTKPWAHNLKTLGGKFNGNLKNGPGWIFSRNKEEDIMNFIVQANGGLLQPMASAYVAQPVQYTSPAVAPMVPFGAVQPSMSPQAALSRLNIIKPPVETAPQLTSNIPRPSSPLQRPSLPSIPRPSLPMPSLPSPIKPVTQGIAYPQQVSFPNVFVAGDGLTYQVVLYTVVMPSLGQKLTLTVGDEVMKYKVTKVSNAPPFDDIEITKFDDEDKEIENTTSRAIVMNGKWRVYCMQDEHILTFL